MQTLFVTGADGFIGSHLIHYFRQRGYDVVAGVRNRARKLALERQFGKALVCDVSDAINVARAIASVRPDGIIHLAGTTRATDAADEPLNAYQSIVSAWANILDGARRAVPRAKLVMTSAADVYGNQGSGGNPLSEDVRPDPISTFGSLKATAESIAHTFFDNYHLDVTIVRPFNVLGAGQPDSSYFGAAAKCIAGWSNKDGDSLQWPDLDCTRDLLHVQDAIEAFERILQNGKPDGVYNLCSGTGSTCGDVLNTLVQGAGKNVHVTALPIDDDTPQIRCLIGDNRRMREELGWNPTHTLEQACREMLRSHQAPTPVGSWS